MPNYLIKINYKTLLILSNIFAICTSVFYIFLKISDIAQCYSEK